MALKIVQALVAPLMMFLIIGSAEGLKHYGAHQQEIKQDESGTLSETMGNLREIQASSSTCVKESFEITGSGGVYYIDGSDAQTSFGPRLYEVVAPSSHPVAFLGSGGCTPLYTGDASKKTTKGSTDYYHGTITLDLTSCTSGKVSLDCSLHGAMSGTDRLVYSTSCDECVATSFAVTGSGGVYYIDGKVDTLSFGQKTYTLTAPSTHPIAFIGAGGCTPSYTGDASKKTTKSSRDYYHGTVTLDLTSCSSGEVSLDCEFHGSMNGLDRLVYSPFCNAAATTTTAAPAPAPAPAPRPATPAPTYAPIDKAVKTVFSS